MTQLDQMIRSPNAARMMGIIPGTLRAWRVIGKGPKYIKVGCTVFYKESDIKAWLDEREYENTSQHEKVVS
jgi:predicted DNA-binding transcriptional regulator AlpA